METIFTTKQQLAFADKVSNTQQYDDKQLRYRDPELSDILELPVKKHSPRWAWAVVDSPEGFGPAHTIKLHFATMEGLPCEGVCYKSKDDCIKDIIAFYIFKMHYAGDEVVDALNLKVEKVTHSVMCAHPDRYDLIGDAAGYVRYYSEKIVALTAALEDKYEKEAAERFEAWEKEYRLQPEGTLEELYDSDRPYLYLEAEVQDGSDWEVICFRASKRGSGFYYERLNIYEYTFNWTRVPVRMADQIRYRNDWCPVMWATWREMIHQKKEQFL